MVYTCPGAYSAPRVRTWPSRATVGQTDGTVAQTVIAQLVLPTCSIYDHDTFPEYGVCVPGRPRSWSRNTGLSSLNNSA